jgi:hypothetical protein
VATSVNDVQPPRSFEQRMAAYRGRIRNKLQTIGLTGTELDSQTDEVMNRQIEFGIMSLLDIE